MSQRGQWDTAVTELGVRSGIFKKHGLDIETLYTQGGPAWTWRAATASRQ